VSDLLDFLSFLCAAGYMLISIFLQITHSLSLCKKKITETNAKHLLLNKYDEHQNIYDHRQQIFELHAMGVRIGIPDDEPSIDDIETLRVNGFTIYIDLPPKFI